MRGEGTLGQSHICCTEQQHKGEAITAHSSRHLSPPWNTHKEKRSNNLLQDTNGSTYAGYLPSLSLNYYLIKDIHLPEDELASLSFCFSCCDRKSWVTGLRIRTVEINLNVQISIKANHVRRFPACI